MIMWPFRRHGSVNVTSIAPVAQPSALNMAPGDTLSFITNGQPWHINDNSGGTIVYSPVKQWVLIDDAAYEEFRRLKAFRDEKVKCPTCQSLYRLLWG